MVRRALRWTTTPTTDDPAEQLFLLCDTLADLVRCEGPDLTARQMTALLTVYLMAGPHTVRGLAADLNVSKPAITRALNRLGEFDLVRRKPDPSDRRSVLVSQTRTGLAFQRDLGQIMQRAERERKAAQSAERTADTAPAVKGRTGMKGRTR